MKTDFLIVGSGIAGLSLALKLADLGRVTVITKKAKEDTSTRLAQGGIACVLSGDDDFVLHEYDTITAGDGLCHEDVVKTIVRQGPERISELERLGVKFSRKGPGQDFELGMEGGHSRRRIVHSGDFTGLEIEKVLVEKAMAIPSIEVLEDFMVVDLLTLCKLESPGWNNSNNAAGSTGRCQERCLGAYVLDSKTQKIHRVLASYV